jgi:hypothetical protein
MKCSGIHVRGTRLGHLLLFDPFLASQRDAGKRGVLASQASVRLLRDARQNVGNDPGASSLANFHCAFGNALPRLWWRFRWVACELGSSGRKNLRRPLEQIANWILSLCEPLDSN